MSSKVYNCVSVEYVCLPGERSPPCKVEDSIKGRVDPWSTCGGLWRGQILKAHQGTENVIGLECDFLCAGFIE